MSRDKNKETLARAIARLPEYEAPAEVWFSIGKALEREAESTHLKEALRRLPTYEAPALVWEGIEAELDRAPAHDLGRIRRLPAWAGTAAAALFLLLIGLAWIYQNRGESGTEEVIFSEEQVVEAQFVPDWDAEEEAFQRVLQEFASRPYLQDNQQLLRLQEELEELNTAKSEVKAMMEVYGEDAQLVRQISDIERERTEVIKELASAI